jgi:aminoglycoside 6-adenylyltransferase
MFDLILNTARQDERIRAVILNGSRANPNAPKDLFQDYDIVYLVTDVASFKSDPRWIERFGELVIMQTPDDMGEKPPGDDESYAYLMQFADGKRIDLTLYPLAGFNEMERDSLSVLLLDKDGMIGPFPPPDESDYLPLPPTAKGYADCCNEFWWVCTYVAKGLWRREITYARYMLDNVMRKQLMSMLAWHIGIRTQFSRNPGSYGKYFERYLEPELWEMLCDTYADSAYEHTWEALFTMCNLFRITAAGVAAHFGFAYPDGDDKRVMAYLQRVQTLPGDAKEMILLLADNRDTGRRRAVAGLVDGDDGEDVCAGLGGV